MEEFSSGNFILGECLAAMTDIPDASIDLILCDLPYGTTACNWDTIIPFEPLWEAYWRIAKPKAAIVLTASQPFTSALVMSQVSHFRHEWIWRKEAGSNFTQMKWQPMKEHESVLVFGRGVVNYNPIKQPRVRPIKAGNRPRHSGKRDGLRVFDDSGFEIKDADMRCPSSVQNFNRERGLHPTQKPVALFEYLIKTYSNEGDTVLDNCAGSGTTAIAAMQSNRRWICIERDPTFYDLACQRVQALETSLRTPI